MKRIAIAALLAGLCALAACSSPPAAPDGPPPPPPVGRGGTSAG